MHKKIAMLTGLVLTGWAQAFVPQSGTWIVTSEANGAPGRGLAIDVQEDTLVMQMYAYERSGQPTFYMASGTLDNNRLTTQLGRYSGGRYLGSGPMSGKEDGSPGNVTLRFTSGITGFITLPGEGEVAIRRFEFGLTRTPAAVAGSWVYVGIDSDEEFGELVTLSQSLGKTTNGTGVMADPDKKIGCEYRVVDEGPYNLFCGLVSGSSVTWIAKLKVVGNEGEGISLNPSNGREEGIVYVRKLTDGKGRYLGLFAPEPAPTPAPSPAPTPSPAPAPKPPPAPAPTPTPSPAPTPATSPLAGTYSVSGGGVSVTFVVASDGSINQCSAGILVTCSGRAYNPGSFSLTGSDGDGTTVTLSGSIDASGKVSGSYSGTSDGERISGAFSGSRRSSASTPAPAPAPSPAANTSRALAFCWQNDKKSYWWCDGRIQEVLIGELNVNEQLQLAGCKNPVERTVDTVTLTRNRDGLTRTGYLYACSMQLQSYERDMRKIWRGIPAGW